MELFELAKSATLPEVVDKEENDANQEQAVEGLRWKNIMRHVMLGCHLWEPILGGISGE